MKRVMKTEMFAVCAAFLLLSLVGSGCTPPIQTASDRNGGAAGGNLTVNITPSFGVIAGGQRIAIKGLGIQSIPTILIGGNECTNPEFDARDIISCKTPAGTAGKKDVEIKSGATRYYMVRECFEYLAPLVLDAISPVTGRANGGTRVTLTGNGFAPGATVLIGSGGCTDVSLTDATTLSCTTPEKNGAGIFPVIVTNSNGDKATLASGYTVYDPPVVTSVSPAQGPIGGGTAVEVVGSGMHTGVTVLIGSSVCGSMTINSEYKISCTTASGSSGTKTVTVVDESGQQGSLANGFTFVASPSVAQIVPSSGSIAGGDYVTVIGNNFVNGAVVKFGTSTCTSNVYSAADTLTCVAPANAEGGVTITVTNPDGQQGQLAAGYTYTAISAPNVTAISPNFGPTTGSTAVSIAGTNFALGATVTIGGTTCLSTTFVSSRSITCITPAGEAGAQHVVVTNPNTQTGTLTGGFTYTVTSFPVIASVSPNFGSIAGGTVVVIRGSSFLTGVKVTIDGIACASLTRVESTELSCTTPAGTIGAKVIGVRNPNGTSVVGASPNVFNYTNGFPPSISVVDPNSGPTAGGTTLTTRGQNFVSGATVLIGGAVTVTCLNSTFVDATTLTCTTPSGYFGQRTVNVVNPDGQTGTALANAFAYNTPYTPTVSSAVPNWGPVAGGTTVTVNGSNFQTGAIAQIGTAAGNYANCATTTVVSATQLTCVTPPGTYGAKIINVINPDGSTGAGASGVFTYSNGQKPTVTFVTPNTGAVTGGTSVTVLGSNFMQGAIVQFSASNMNTINCPTTYVSATQLTCVTPPGSYGSYSVNVLNPDGGAMTTAVANAFGYLLGYAPIIRSVFPNSGWIGGETQLSIIGSGFDTSNPSPLITLMRAASAPNPAVYANCTNPVIVSSTLASCTVPAGSVGSTSLTLYNGDGQSATQNSAFTYSQTRTFQKNLHGSEDNAEFGMTLVNLGNIDGVTGPEFAVAAPSSAGASSTTHAGKVYVYSAANMTTPLCTITSPSPVVEGSFGYSVAAVNLNGSAGGIVIGEPGGGTSGAGKAYVYNLVSNCTGNASLSNGAELLATLSGSGNANASFGFSVTAGKIMTTALSTPNWDVVVGEPNNGATELGAVYMFNGNTGPYNNVATVGSPVAGTSLYDHVGYAVQAIDLDNDTYAEVAVGAPGYGTAATTPNQGGVYILKGLSALDWTIANRYYAVASGAPIQPSATANWRTGTTLAVAGKVTDDRRLDLLVGAPGGGSANTGAIYVYSIPVSTSTAITTTGHFFSASGPAAGLFGRAIAGVGDYNGDGRDDFIVGYPSINATGGYTIYSGQEAAQGYAFAYSGVTLEPTSAFGRAFAPLGDINGDGRADLLIGEPWANAGGPRRGRVFVLLGP